MRLVNHLCDLCSPVKRSLDSPSAAWVEARLFSRRDAVQAQCELCSCTTGSLGVHCDGLPVDVVQVIAGLVVARIFWGTGAGEETRGGDSELQEGNIVRR